MNTREHILHTALKLYNAGGTDAVTVRHIAAEMGISHGNLCYHFPNTQAIVRELYLGLVEKMDRLVSEALTLDPSQLGIKHLVHYTRSAFENFYEYRFLMLDFSRVMRSDHWIRDHYRELVNGRRLVFRGMLQLMQQLGLVREEHTPGEFDYIVELQLISGDFWMPRAEIMPRMPKNEMLDYYVRVWLAPYPGILTKKGLDEWNAFFAGPGAAPAQKKSRRITKNK